MSREYDRERYRKVRAAAVSAMGGACRQCGFSDARALQIDHVTTCGASSRNATLVICYEVLRGENLDAYQLLCANCNWIKRYEADEVPLRGPSPRAPRERKRGYKHKPRVVVDGAPRGNA
jgi:hypothetical protein